MLGIPFVATDYEPYQDLPVILVKNDVDEWHIALRDLVLNPDWQDTVGQNLNDAIVNLSIQKNWKVYEDICKKD